MIKTVVLLQAYKSISIKICIYLKVLKSPYIVDQFITTNDMNVVWQDQHDIIEEYRDDFAKHLDENENEEIDLTLLARINRVFESIPAQLAKETALFL